MLQFLISLAISSTVVSVIALVLSLCFRLQSKQIATTSRSLLWAILVIGLLLPVRPTIETPIFQLPPAASKQEDSIALQGVAITYEQQIDMLEPNVIEKGYIEYGFDPTFLITCLFLLWISGLISFLLYYAIKHYRFCSYIRRWSSPISDTKLLHCLAELKKTCSIHQIIGIYCCPHIHTPMTYGIFHPKIVIP